MVRSGTSLVCARHTRRGTRAISALTPGSATQCDRPLTVEAREPYHDGMIRRSKAREVALQLLYQRDLNPDVPRKVIEAFVEDRLPTTSLRGYCLTLYDGTLVHQADIDRRLTEVAENWKLPRMAAVDRNVLRLGAFELLHGTEPAAVVFNEWIELARRFGGAGSPAFVNGILDRVHRAVTPAS